MIRIEMRYTDEYGNTTSLDKETTLYPDQGNNEIDEMEKFINHFLRGVGYPSFNKDKIILESVTEDEYEEIVDYLWDMRHKESENNDQADYSDA